MRSWLIAGVVAVVGALLLAAAPPATRDALLRPLATEYYYRSGWRALQRRDLRRAEQLFTRAHTRAARPAEMSARIGLAYGEQGLARPAARWLTRALDASPDQPASVYLGLGSARWLSGDLEGATAPLERAVALLPNDPMALNALGYLYAERRVGLDRAVVLLVRALRLLPADAPAEMRLMIEDSLGWAYYQRGDYRRALPPLERADKGLNAGKVAQADVAYHLGMAYLALDRRKRGLAALRRAAEAGSAPARATLKSLGAATP
jgi:Flp pilus assembly protein TadD